MVKFQKIGKYKYKRTCPACHKKFVTYHGGKYYCEKCDGSKNQNKKVKKMPTMKDFTPLLKEKFKAEEENVKLQKEIDLRKDKKKENIEKIEEVEENIKRKMEYA